MYNKIIILFICLLACHCLKAQKPVSIHGIISDSSGSAIENASVKSISTQTGTFSNTNGFNIILRKLPDTLLISHIGYKSEYAVVKNTQPLHIVLTPVDDQLEDVDINTGYQKLKPNEINGSYVVIDNRMLNQQTGLNILDRLNGVTSSLLFNVGKHNPNPQSNTGITIRGLSTINGPLDPLIVVDNFIYDGDINNINPNDVESITVLKDAAAASIWGARAGNGVIVITTKKGKFNQQLQVDFNTDVIMTGKPNLFYNKQISVPDYINYEQFLFNQGYYDDVFTDYEHPPFAPALQVFEDKRNGLISAEDSASQINALKKIDSRSQYTKYYYRKGVIQQYALNLRGGSRNIGWLVAGDFDKDLNNLRASFNKINLRFENTYRPVKNMTISAGVYYTNSTNKSGLPDYTTLTTPDMQYIPYLNLVGPDGTNVAVPRYYDPRFIDTVGGGKLMNWNYYPLEDYKHNRYVTNTEEILAHIGMDYKIINGLDINLLYQYQKQNVKSSNIADTAGYYARNLINQFSQIDPSTGVVDYIIPMGGILSQSYDNLGSYNFRGQLNFDRTFGKHRITAIGGMEVRDEWEDGSSASYYGYNADPLTYTTNLDFNDYFPTVTGDYELLPGGNSLSPKTENRFVSFFANASYTYNRKYIVSGSVRRDGSNIFGANTNDKWKPLWSAGLGWDLSKESFYHLPLFSYLKLSATYGVSGNVDLTKTAQPVGSSGTNSLTGLKIIGIDQLNNPDLSWERSYQANFRLDFATAKNIVSGSIEYYRKNGKGLYAPTPFDYTTFGGTGTTITANAADMKGKGIDITLHSNNISRALTWTTDFLFDFNTSTTAKYYGSSATSVSALIGNGTSIMPVVGKPLYAIAAYRWGGLDAQGNPQGYLHDTLSEDYNAIQQNAYNNGIAGGSFKYIGSATPVTFGSILNSFSYKGFTLSFNIMYKFGYYLLRPSLSYYALAASGIAGTDYDKRWQQPGDEKKTNVPSFAYPLSAQRDQLYAGSEINIIKGDYIRLQFVNLSYSLLNNNSKRPFHSVQIYVNVANLGIIWRANKYHIDPDYVNTIPQPKIYTIGIKTNF